MALILRKKAPTPSTSAPAPVTPKTPEVVPKAGIQPPKAVSKPLPPKLPVRPVVKPSMSAVKPPVQLTAPGKVLKIAAPPVEEAPKAKLPPLPKAEPPVSKYTPAPPGTKVRITSEKFPWVKHYKPGDEGEVVHRMHDSDPLGISEDGSHQTHIVSITNPTDPSRKGQRAALFRWEFEVI